LPGQRGRSQARQGTAFPGQVRLVRVAGLGRESGQVVGGLAGGQAGVDPGDEPPETEHPLQGLGTVADHGVATAA
jgi:hypothetical protein